MGTSTKLIPKAQEIFQKTGWKEYMSQKIRCLTVRLCFQVMSETTLCSLTKMAA